MNSYFTFILYAVQGSEKMLTVCIVVVFRETFRMEWLRKDVFIFNLTGVYVWIRLDEYIYWWSWYIIKLNVNGYNYWLI